MPGKDSFIKKRIDLDDDSQSDEDDDNNIDNDDNDIMDDDDDQIDDNEDEDKEEEDEEEEDEKPMRHSMKRSMDKKSSKHKRGKRVVNVIDEEAEEDDIDDEDEPEVGYDIEKFRESEEAYKKLYARKQNDIYGTMIKHLEETATREAELPMPRLNNRKVIKEVSISEPEQQEIDEAELHKQRELQTAAVMEYTNARLLPTIQDPKIYSVRVRRGSEMQAVLSLTYKYNEYEGKRLENNLPINETYIFSAFWTGEESIIYIEAYDESMVRNMVAGMSLFLSGYKNAFTLIPIQSRTLLFEIPQKNRPIPLNGYVRVKKGLYKGDLGQVMRLMEDSMKVVLKLVPRIDMSDINGGSYSAFKVRPEQKFFDMSKLPEDKIERKNNPRLGGIFYEYNRNYYRDGMLYKEFFVQDLIQDAQPSVEEKVMFAEKKTIDPRDLYQDGVSKNEQNQSNQNEDSTKMKLFFKGDTVRLISGELKNLEGVVEEADINRHEVQVKVDVGDDSELLLLKEEEIIKTFKIGVHVKIIAGVYSGETGTVVMISENDNQSYAIVMGDYGDKEMRVFVNYMVMSVEVSKGLVSVEGFELFDLVALPGAKVGVIIQLAAHSLKVLDQNSRVREFDIKLIRSKKNTISRTSTLLDVRQMQVHEGDSVLIVEGDYKGKNGTVKRIWRNYVFVHCPAVTENNGIVLVRNRQIESDGENQQKKKRDTKDAIESMTRQPGSIDYASTKKGSRNKKDTLKDGTSVMVKEGRYKGLKGYIFDSNDTHVKIVFHSRPQPVSVLRSAVMIIDGISTDNAEMDMSRLSSMAPPPMKQGIYDTWNPPTYGINQMPTQGINPNEKLNEPVELPDWCAKGVRVHLQNGSNDLIKEINKSDGTVLLDKCNEYKPINELQPERAFAPGQDVMVYDDPSNRYKAVVDKIDANDVIVSIDGTKRYAHNTVIIDPSYYI